MVAPEDRKAAEPIAEPEHIDDHVYYDLPVRFTKSCIGGDMTIRWYENGDQKVAIGGDAVALLDRRGKRTKKP